MCTRNNRKWKGKGRKEKKWKRKKKGSKKGRILNNNDSFLFSIIKFHKKVKF